MALVTGPFRLYSKSRKGAHSMDIRLDYSQALPQGMRALNALVLRQGKIFG